MINDKAIDKLITERLVEADAKRKEEHQSSGKLSAGMLNDPLQWMILKSLGVPQKEIEPYVLRKFLRGNQVEDWIVEFIPGLKEKQKFLEYKDCIGYCDAVADTKDWDFNVGTIPVEIKSVTNLKFKRIMKSGEPDKSHLLQACFYAIALGSEHFAVVYVAADDLRVKTYVLETSKYKQEIDEIIDRYNEQIKTGIVPVFEPREKYHSMLQYSKYPDWAELNQEEIKEKIKDYV